MPLTRADLAAANERLKVQVEEARSELAKVQNQYTEHLTRIGRTAMEYAEEHDMCDVVEEALEAADVPYPTQEVTFEIYYPITVTIRGGISKEDIEIGLMDDVVIDQDAGYSLSGDRYRDPSPVFLQGECRVRLMEVKEQ